MAPYCHLPVLTTCTSRKFGQQCICSKFGQPMAQNALVQNLVIRWHHLHCLQSWPPGCVICIATLPWITLLALSVSIELVSSSARLWLSVKSQQCGVLKFQTTGLIDRTPGIPGSDKNNKETSKGEKQTWLC